MRLITPLDLLLDDRAARGWEDWADGLLDEASVAALAKLPRRAFYLEGLAETIRGVAGMVRSRTVSLAIQSLVQAAIG